jgi:GNAT superfamily N-acetyltransferase
LLLIRPAATHEREALEALQWRASLDNTGDREALLAHPDAIELPSQQIAAGHVFVAELDGAVAGFAAVLLRDDGDIELDGLFVEPNLQKQGIGRRLVEHCVDFTRAKRASMLHVIGNAHAEAFYGACGFVHAGTVKTRFGAGLLMRKKLLATGADA